ncbi:MAG: ATPase domain-containing protein [Persicimonas sp.]
MIRSEQADIPTGVPGLDTILHGGLPCPHAYLVKGSPGTGKTSLALQFLSEGARRGEPTVYISFSESRTELNRVANSHGWPLDDIEVCELAADISQRAVSGSSIFHGAEIDLPEVLSTILEVVERVEPTRLALDSLTALRYMAETHRHYRRALFQLKVSLEEAGVTALFVGEKSERAKTEAESLVHGVIDLEMNIPEYGPVKRYLQVGKIRGRSFETGFHDFSIVTGGLEVYPRVRPEALRRRTGEGEPLKSGVESLDKLLGGGFDGGTTGVILGPSGTGKTLMVVQYAIAAAERGEKALIYTFSEDVATLEQRAERLDLPLGECLDSGMVTIEAIDPPETSPGHFFHKIRRAISGEQVSFVALDSLNGYSLSVPKRQALIPHLHELRTHLGRKGVAMLLIITLSGIFGTKSGRSTQLSYLADAIVYLRYFEEKGVVRKAITAVKNRARDHEKLVREFIISAGGVKVGAPLPQFNSLRTSEASDE